MAKTSKTQSGNKGKIPTAEFVRQILHYDPETGIFTWRINRAPRGKKGTIAGTVAPDDRRFIGIYQRSFRSSRLAWLYMTGEWPENEIDHENGKPADDRWRNLRKATHLENMRNTKRRAHSKQPYKGICKHNNGWCARITVNWKQIHLGYFHTPEEAYACYVQATKTYHKNFARAD